MAVLSCNRTDLLRHCFPSSVCQTLAPIELVVSDIRRARKELDGSPRVSPEEGVWHALDPLGTQPILKERIGAN